MVAFVVPGAAVLLADALGDDPITGRTLLVAALTALVTSGSVYGARNGRSPDPTTSTPGPRLPTGDAGHLDAVTGVALIVVVALGLILGTFLLRLL